MSKTTIVGGKILESTGGDFNIYAKENIVYSSATTITETGVEKGVNFGDPIKYVKTENAVLRQFLVHFRRPSDYDGKYGFDWLRDEYIYPIIRVGNDNNGRGINTQMPLCKNPSALKAEYRTTDVRNPISPYGKEYFPAWLAIFPHTTTAQFAHGSQMHKDGVTLDIDIEEIEALASDATEILFECTNRFVTISPAKLNLSSLIGRKQTKNLGGSRVRNYYHNTKKVNIKCSGGALTSHEEVKVFAKLGSQKVEVGKLMLHRNNVIPKAEIVAINFISNSSSRASLRSDYQFLFKYQSFNQALIRAEIKVDTEFDLNSLPANDRDVIDFKRNYINATANVGTANASSFKEDLIKLYEKFGKHKPGNARIDTNANKRTYLFYTNISAQDILPNGGRRSILGSCSANINVGSSGNISSIDWGNAYVIYNTGLATKSTVLHEGAHSFSLPHTFQEGAGLSPYVFYKGFLDNIMDYVNQTGVAARNPYEANDKMNNFFKWQWKLMRQDRSLIFNY